MGLPPVNSQHSDQVVPVYADIAASVQQVLNDKLLLIAKHVFTQTKNKNLCYSGGVALNGVSNWHIFQHAGFSNIHIHPAAGDSGGAVGAALYIYHHILGKPRVKSFTHPYLGSENTASDVKRFLTTQSIKHTTLSDTNLTAKVSQLLTKGKVIGWVKGRFEWGPRALGARSILADPRKKSMKDVVNSKIKFREGFRPFAPVCLFEQGSTCFDVGTGARQQPLEYMLAVVPVKPSWQSKLGAITHVDGTARPQFIRKTTNLPYYSVINNFYQLTGVPVLLNTSFNLKGEPIVNTAQQAYATFIKSGLDALVLENFLIQK